MIVTQAVRVACALVRPVPLRNQTEKNVLSSTMINVRMSASTKSPHPFTSALLRSVLPVLLINAMKILTVLDMTLNKPNALF